jgi:transketolase C-terminal domain/subunit
VSKSATREAYGTAIAKLGDIDPRVVALDADVKNSTFSEKFEKKFPERFYQNFIAEQAMIGLGDGPGGARRDSVPVHVCLLPHARGRLHPHGGDQ